MKKNKALEIYKMAAGGYMIKINRNTPPASGVTIVLTKRDLLKLKREFAAELGLSACPKPKCTATAKAA